MKTVAFSIAAAAVLLAGAADAAPANAPRPKDLTNRPRVLAASDYLLTLEGIKGESKAVALDQVDWRAMPTAGCSGKLGPGSMVIAGDLPPAAAAANVHVRLPPPTVAGQHIKKAVLHVRKQGEESAMTVELEDVLITSATPTAAQGSSAVPSLGKLGRMEYGGGSWSVKGCQG